MANLTISSLNCQGLGDMQKRRDVFHYIKKRSHNIYCLQDTHFDTKLEKYVSAEWGYSCLFASYQSNARGVAVLFNNNFEFKIKNVDRDINGNYIIILLTVMGKDLLLVNIYGPNKDNPIFYDTINEKIKEYEKHGLVIVGDWNLVLDPHYDYNNYKHINNPKATEAVERIISDHSLTDVWRENNPEIRRFTWRKSSPLKQSRLDFFLLCDHLLLNYRDSDIIPGYRSDHSMIILKLTFGEDIKHNNYWKFNSSLLRDGQYAKEINDVIDNTILEYSTNALDKDTIQDTLLDEIDLTISDKLFLDFLLMKIRGKTIGYATARKKKAVEKENELIKEIENLEKLNTKTEIDVTTLKEKNDELLLLRQKRIEGVMLRSKAKWIAEGEKISNYFCNLEKRHYVSKSINKLYVKNGLTEDSNEISKEINTFYKNLYAKRILENVEISDLIDECPKLAYDEKQSLEGKITLAEAGIALTHMQNGKSPGTDGFGAEFYKFFWKKLGPFVVRALNQSFKDGELSNTQREGIITCIPKPDKDRDHIKNWRPISLLNVMYKIGSACIANRLKTVLPCLISADQSGFVPGRYMGENVRLIYDLIGFLDKTNTPGLLLCLDFEKAFDSLDWSFLFRVLRAFGFGESICKWVETFYKNIKSTVIVNGNPTEWFHIQRGCRQGDPLSPYLFVLCAEILAIMIKEDKDIKGIEINNKEIKISQFADDAQLINAGDRISFEKSITLIKKFGNASGLYMNEDKTQAIWMGSKKHSNVKYLPQLNINWNPSKFKILGIWFSTGTDICDKLNFDEHFSEIKKLINIWMKRSITPVGRVAVLRSLLLSKLIHLWILLPDPPDTLVNNLQKMCFRFVWQDKQDKISRKMVVKSVKNGGLNVPDIKQMIKALKLTWIRRFHDSKHKWIIVANESCPFLCNISKYGPSYLPNRNVTNKFWIDVFKAYTTFFNCVRPTTLKELCSEPVFFNERINIDRNIVPCKTLSEKGIHCISHFLKDNGNFLTLHEFNEKYNTNTHFLVFNCCKMSIKEYVKKFDFIIDNNECELLPKAITILLTVKKGTRLYYDILMQNENMPNCCQKWSTKINENIQWNKVFLNIHKIEDVKLKWFQMRIVHRIIGTNVVLKEMGITQNSNCNFCFESKDDIDHLFWNCVYIQRFWVQVEDTMKSKCLTCTNLRLSQCLILFGVDPKIKTDSVFDLIMLLGKMHIYKCKLDNRFPTIRSFEKDIKARYKVEEYNSKMNFTIDEFKTKWCPYKSLVSGNA